MTSSAYVQQNHRNEYCGLYEGKTAVRSSTSVAKVAGKDSDIKALGFFILAGFSRAFIRQYQMPTHHFNKD